MLEKVIVTSVYLYGIFLFDRKNNAETSASWKCIQGLKQDQKLTLTKQDHFLLSAAILLIIIINLEAKE